MTITAHSGMVMAFAALPLAFAKGECGGFTILLKRMANGECKVAADVVLTGSFAGGEATRARAEAKRLEAAFAKGKVTTTINQSKE